jgi:hypothetical protein
MVPSPNGKSLALLTMSGMLWVVSTDFQRNLAEFDSTSTGAEGSVRQVEWCGNDAILVTWDALVLLVGPFGDTIQCVQLQMSPYITDTKHRYYYTGPTFAVTEVDGVRVIAADACDLIQKVPGNKTFHKIRCFADCGFSIQCVCFPTRIYITLGDSIRRLGEF